MCSSAQMAVTYKSLGKIIIPLRSYMKRRPANTEEEIRLMSFNTRPIRPFYKGRDAFFSSYSIENSTATMAEK